MKIDWASCFDNFGLKVVSRTDKKKSAYVLNKKQLSAVLATGLQPAATRPGVPFHVTLFLENNRAVRTSFYNAERKGAGRSPEPRMGLDFITSWLNEGDMVVIGNIGNQLFAAKISDHDLSIVQAAESIAKRADSNTRKSLIDRAKAASGKPARKVVHRNDFARNPAVVMGAVARADGKCEMPGCLSKLFERDDDSPYLEVHHVTPLAEDGEDSLLNAAALCPMCHRHLHFGKNRMELREILARHIAALS